jgi:NADH:ubiquinone oxidoreductase subunit 4 (subunit M)
MEKGYFGEFNPQNKVASDIGFKEMATAVPLIVLILAIGVYPAPLLEKIEPAMKKIMTTSTENP